MSMLRPHPTRAASVALDVSRIGAIRARQVPPAPPHHAIASATHNIGLPAGSSWL